MKYLDKIHGLLLFGAGLISGLYFMGMETLGPSLHYFPGDLIDGRFNNYLLEHAWLFFTGQTPHYWNAPFMYPEAGVISYSDNLLGSAPFYFLFRMAGANRETSFQLWYILIMALNYTCAYLFFNYLFKTHLAALCGAFVFAFSIALQSQMGHAQTFPRFATPLAFLALAHFLNTFKPVWFFTALLMLVWQIYCGIYLGLMLIVPFGLAFCVSIVLYRKSYKLQWQQKKWWLHMTLSVMAIALLLVPLLLPYLLRAKAMGMHPYTQILESIPTPLSYFFTWKGTAVWDKLSDTCLSYPAFWDHEIFPGGFGALGMLSALLMGVLFLFRKKIKSLATVPAFHLVFFITAVFTFLLFLRLGDFSLYRLIYSIPGFGSMRALQRVINIELLFFAGGLAWLSALIIKRNTPGALICGLALLPLLLADNFMSGDFIHRRSKEMAQQRVNALLLKINKPPPATVLCFEPDSLVSLPMDYHLDAMLASQTLKIKTMNGYSATSPGGFGDYWVKPCEKSRRIWIERKAADTTNIFVVN